MGIDDKLTEKIESLSDKEKKLLLSQLGEADYSSIKKHRHQYPKDNAKFGYISDTHIGHNQFKEELFVKAMHTFIKEGINNVYHAGDILEGMSGRDGHIYELSQVGFSSQINYATELFKSFPSLNFYAIDGNHDEWYRNKNNGGLIVGEELEARVKNFHSLGLMEATVEIAPNVNMFLYHGRDGTAYASSYKLQKLIESFTGGEKPKIILSGHYHKALALWSRNVFGVECGTLCSQTPFMKGKKLPAHMGFGILNIWYDKKGVERIDHTFFPFYD